MEKSSKILVTGANGHVGFNLIKTLQDRGYTNLRVSVRDAQNPEKSAALRGLGLTDIVSLDIRDAEAFEQASAGVDVLFHVAATYRIYTGGADADRGMIKDSLDGVRAAMNAAAKQGVSKIVLTSSIVTLPHTAKAQFRPDETVWATDLRVPYIRAKTEGEQLAWKLAEELGLNLVTILPGAILGPNFGKGTQTTDYILAPMMGSMRLGTIRATLPIIDVRDVVDGHILAAEQDANGRFVIGADDAVEFPEILNVMRRVDPKTPKALSVMPRTAMRILPMFDWVTHKLLGTPRIMTREMAQTMATGSLVADNSRAKRELGWHPKIGLEQTLRDTMQELKSTHPSRFAAGL